MNLLCHMHIFRGSRVEATHIKQFKDKNGEDYYIATCNECREAADKFVQETLPLVEAIHDFRK